MNQSPSFGPPIRAKIIAAVKRGRKVLDLIH